MNKRISYRKIVKASTNKGLSKLSNATKKARQSRIHIRQANAFELQVFRLVNEERTSRGIAALTLNTQLTDLAGLKSRDMRDNNYFSHTSPTYGTPGQLLDRFGVDWRAYGENIAAGQPTPVGGLVMGASDIASDPNRAQLAIPYLIAFIATLIVTYFSMRWFMGIMAKGNLKYFSYYCFLAGILLLIFM